jgi:hypothetical protein
MADPIRAAYERAFTGSNRTAATWAAFRAGWHAATRGVSVVGSQPSSSHTTGKVRGTEGISFDPAQGPEVTGGEA